MTDDGTSGPTATSDVLAGTEWAIVSIDGAPVGQGELVVRFGHDGRVSGSTGINHLTASYSVTAEYLTFGPLATSRHGGSAAQVDQEHRVVASLAGMCSFRLGPQDLLIDGPLGLVELEAVSPPPVSRAPGDEARAD